MEGNGGEEREREREMMIVCCLFDSVLYQKQLEVRSTYLKVGTYREREREREIERERERGKEEGSGREQERGGVRRVCRFNRVPGAHRGNSLRLHSGSGPGFALLVTQAQTVGRWLCRAPSRASTLTGHDLDSDSLRRTEFSAVSQPQANRSDALSSTGGRRRAAVVEDDGERCQ